MTAVRDDENKLKMNSSIGPGPARQMAVFHVAGEDGEKKTKTTQTNKTSCGILSHPRETASFVCTEQRQNRTFLNVAFTSGLHVEIIMYPKVLVGQ